MENKIISGKQAIWYRNYRRARDRAMVRLTHAYPETYKELLEQEKASDITEGKNYVAFDNDAGITVAIRSDAGHTGVSEHENRSADSRNEGAEA